MLKLSSNDTVLIGSYIYEGPIYALNYLVENVSSSLLAVSMLTHRRLLCPTVTIRSTTRDAYFKGFTVQARDPLTGQPATTHHLRGGADPGRWLSVNNVKGLPECAAVTHADRGQKSEASFTWQGRTDLAF